MRSLDTMRLESTRGRRKRKRTLAERTRSGSRPPPDLPWPAWATSSVRKLSLLKLNYRAPPTVIDPNDSGSTLRLQ